MSNEFLGDRRKALEAEFFRRQEAALLARLRAEDQRRAERAALAAAASIRDEALLDQLVALGISADTLTALALVPLAEIAWADGKVEDAEKQAILVAARAAGLEETSGGHRLLESCLSEPPQAKLRKLWEHYVKSICATLSVEERTALRSELLQRARGVAEAAGGIMGLGSRVSKQEEALLSEFARAFNP